MKRTSIFLISFFIVVITFGQDINLPLYLDKKINELMFIDNYSVENQTLDNIYYQRIKRPDLKSNLDVTQKLDSIQTMIYHLELNLWTLSTKNEFTYDEKGNTTIIIEYDWKSNINDWLPENKTEKFFNEQNQQFLETRDYWLIDSNQWVQNAKYEYEYYVDGSIKTEKFTEKDFSSNNWICKWRTDYNYDINGLLQSKLYSAWVIDSNMLVEYKIEEFTYNSFGKVDTYIDKRLNHNTLVWKDHRKTIYTYNDINQDSIILFLELDLATDSLINFNRREYFHNSNGFDKIDILSHWFKSQNQWRFESKVESNYDSSGKRIFIISSIWHSDLSWHQFYKREYVYDYNENLSIYQYYTQTDSTGWYLTQENDYNYDYNFTISECYFQTHESSQIEYWNHMYNIPTDYVIQYVNDGELYELIRLTYYYSDINIGIPEEISNEIIVFPNPTNGKLLILNETYIELDEFRIYNQLGQLVMHKNIISNSIDLSSFIQGIYVIEFVVENMRIRRKIIIK